MLLIERGGIKIPSDLHGIRVRWKPSLSFKPARFFPNLAVVIEVGDFDGNRAGKGAGVVEVKDFKTEQ